VIDSYFAGVVGVAVEFVPAFSVLKGAPGAATVVTC